MRGVDINKSKTTSGYMFDTNIFNQILDEKIDIKLFSGLKCYVTHIQYDEILATNDSKRKTELDGIFLSITKLTIPTESTLLGISRLGQAKLSDGNLYTYFLNKLNSKKRAKSNNNDALIAETALMNNLVLVTNDEALFSTIIKSGGCACKLDEMIQTISKG